MKWEQTSVVIETGGYFSRGKVEGEGINAALQQFGAIGFELVTVIPVSDGSAGTKRIVLFFKRPAPASS